MSINRADAPSRPDCPEWCRLQHASTPVFVHEGPTHVINLSRPREVLTEQMKVRTVEYLPLELPDATGLWGPIVELEHHVGDRYRVINLTSEDARSFAAVLLRAATLVENSAPVGQAW